MSKSNGSLTREQFLAVQNPPPVPLEVPEWGRVYVRVISALERDKLGNDIGGPGGREFWRARIVRYGVCDGDGKPLFSDADVLAIAGKSGVAIDFIADKVIEVNKMRAEDAEAARKNSVAAPADALPAG